MANITYSKERLCSSPHVVHIEDEEDDFLEQPIECVFRYGCHYEMPNGHRTPGFVIDLYQRNAIVTGCAKMSYEIEFPEANQLVEVKGIISRQEAKLAIKVHKLAPIAALGPEQCIFDLALPHWIVDQRVVDRACSLWASLPANNRALINSAFNDPELLHRFLTDQGSTKANHAHAGGLLLQSVEAAEYAVSISSTMKYLDRNSLVTTALINPGYHIGA
jgi:hypothetical protein